jgi:DNA-binding transcriptional ArsR family regulator
MKLIYIIEDGYGHKKIGITSNIERRLSQLKTAISTGVISVMVSDFIENARDVEKKLHETNKKSQLNGEWFSDVIDFCDIDFSYLYLNMLNEFQQIFKLIASNDDLNGSDMRVLMLLLARLDFENYIRVTQKDIAHTTKIKQPHVSTALTKLLKLNIIEKVSQGNLKAYRLNPSYAWKGSIKNLKEETKLRKARKVIPFKAE